MAITIRLEPENLQPDAELRAFITSLNGDGAVVSFTGLMRPTSKEGEALTGLFLDHYPGMTERSISDIATDAAAKFAVEDILIIHRCGLVLPGAAIVFVATSSPHRRAAFEAADYLMDRLKSDAGFWKREDTATGSHWIEPTAQDAKDKERWSNIHAGN
ncbi:MAG: molybdenum cofactor biosynthesis protein MoaE [Sphingobium sp.]|nr:molybdenum cofactor biosynthesis protein MoaE [Sphingobium sp.]